MSPTGTLATTNGSLSTNLSFAKELSLPVCKQHLYRGTVHSVHKFDKHVSHVSVRFKNSGSWYSKEEQHCQASDAVEAL